MSDLDDKMLERMFHLVYDEHTNFSYMDFIDIMKPKTYRNKISKLMKEGIVELDYRSAAAFHTIIGNKFGKSGTKYHTGVPISNNNPVCQMIQNLPMGIQSIHDIHLKFTAPKVYETFPVTCFPRMEGNKAIAVPSWSQNNAIVKITINKNDTITVILGCSLEPIPLDYNGIIRFFTLLGTTQGFLRGLMVLLNSGKLDQQQLIPQYGKWIITRWDFGRDALITYNGEKYEITVERAGHFFARLYTKDFLKKKQLRLERVESPNKTIADAIEEKLNLPI